MTNKEQITRNIGLTFDWVNQLIDNPEELKNLPDNFKVEFVEKDFPKVEKDKNAEKNTKFVKVRNQFELT